MRNNKLFILLCFLAILPKEIYAQDASNIFSLGLWNLNSVSGDLKVGALYGQAGVSSNGIVDKSKIQNYYGGIVLRTYSYIWSPNFLTIGVDGGYLPQSYQDQYLVFPNRYDVINAKNLHLNTSLFPGKPITLTTFANFDQSYDSRENLTDIKTESKTVGGNLSLSNKVLPILLAYNESNWTQKEIQTSRNFLYDQKTFDARVSKVFRFRDRNEFVYSHRDYIRQDYNVSPSRNISDNVELHNSYLLDSAGNCRFSSNILGINQRGIDSFTQLRIAENLFLKLPYKINFNCGYSFYYVNRPSQEFSQHDANFVINRQYYESLYLGVTGDYNNADETDYKESFYNVGANISYNKKLPKNGLLSLSYSYSRTHDNRQSQDVTLHVVSESYLINDNQITMLKLPYIDLASIIVRDVTGTITYQPNFDYILVSRNNYVEIQRQPGGQISNNSTVYISYTATQPGNNQYDAGISDASIDISLFRRLLGLHYKVLTSNYFNLKNSDNMFLNYLTHRIYGIRSEYKFISGGIEIDDYESSLYPYQLTRYYATLQGRYRGRLAYSINGNLRIYNKLPNNEINRNYKDLNGLVSYSFSQRTKLDLNVIYTYQHGREINLDLFSYKLKLTRILRELVINAGLESYTRVYLDVQKNNYTGGYIQIIKKFKY